MKRSIRGLIVLTAVGAGASETAEAEEPPSPGELLAPELERADGALEMSGTVRADWRTSTALTPIGKGTFRYARDGEGRLHLSMTIEHLGRLEMTSDGASAWQCDPVAGVVTHGGDGAKGIHRLLVVLGGAFRAPDLYGVTAPVESEEPGHASFRMGEGDLWVIDRDSGHPVRAEMRIRSGLDEALRVGVAFLAWNEKEGRPREVALDREHDRFTLTVQEATEGGEPEIPGRPALAREAEKAADPTAYRLLDLAEVHVATIRKTVPIAELGRELAIMLPEILFAVQGQGIRSLWTDPGLEPDPSKWRTQVVIPVT